MNFWVHQTRCSLYAMQRCNNHYTVNTANNVIIDRGIRIITVHHLWPNDILTAWHFFFSYYYCSSNYLFESERKEKNKFCLPIDFPLQYLRIQSIYINIIIVTISPLYVTYTCIFMIIPSSYNNIIYLRVKRLALSELTRRQNNCNSHRIISRENHTFFKLMK